MLCVCVGFWVKPKGMICELIWELLSVPWAWKNSYYISAFGHLSPRWELPGSEAEAEASPRPGHSGSVTQERVHGCLHHLLPADWRQGLCLVFSSEGLHLPELTRVCPVTNWAEFRVSGSFVQKPLGDWRQGQQSLCLQRPRGRGQPPSACGACRQVRCATCTVLPVPAAEIMLLKPTQARAHAARHTCPHTSPGLPSWSYSSPVSAPLLSRNACCNTQASVLAGFCHLSLWRFMVFLRYKHL